MRQMGAEGGVRSLSARTYMTPRGIDRVWTRSTWNLHLVLCLFVRWLCIRVMREMEHLMLRGFACSDCASLDLHSILHHGGWRRYPTHDEDWKKWFVSPHPRYYLRRHRFTHFPLTVYRWYAREKSAAPMTTISDVISSRIMHASYLSTSANILHVRCQPSQA